MDVLDRQLYELVLVVLGVLGFLEGLLGSSYEVLVENSFIQRGVFTCRRILNVAFLGPLVLLVEWLLVHRGSVVECFFDDRLEGIDAVLVAYLVVEVEELLTGCKLLPPV